jgi:hypothetical protein
MHNDLAPDDYSERHRLARAAAHDGYVWTDLVVRYGVSADMARTLVLEAEAKRIEETSEENQRATMHKLAMLKFLEGSQ